MDIKEKLIKFQSERETKELAVMFEKYMKNMGFRKVDGRKKDNSNSYRVDGDCTNWNRVECYYYKDNDTRYENMDLGITLRKRSGNYMIVERKMVRAFEVSYGKIICYDEKLLEEIIEEYKGLFELMLGEE